MQRYMWGLGSRALSLKQVRAVPMPRIMILRGMQRGAVYPKLLQVPDAMFGMAVATKTLQCLATSKEGGILRYIRPQTIGSQWEIPKG